MDWDRKGGAGDPYGQLYPLARALEVIGERWTLLVVRELLRGRRRFSEIHKALPQMSRSVLAQRLRSLCDADVVERGDGAYLLTDMGRELGPIVIECGNWGNRWVHRKLKNAALDDILRDLPRRIDVDLIPNQPVVVELEFWGAPGGIARVVLHLSKSEGVEVVLWNPARKADLRLGTTPKTMADVLSGELPFDAAIRSGAVRVDGARELARSLPRWFPS